MPAGVNNKLYSYARWSKQQKLLVFCNFSNEVGFTGDLHIPAEIIAAWNLKDGTYKLQEELYKAQKLSLVVANGSGTVNISLQPLGSVILSVR